MPRLASTQLPPPSSWEEFENIAHAIWKEEWGDEHAQKNGRNGQAQNGVDIFGERKGQQLGVQCKGKDNFTNKNLTEKEIRTECKKAKTFRPKLKELIFATTGPRDASIQEIARRITQEHKGKRLFKVRVYSWPDILTLLEKHDDIARSYYPDFFGPSESKLLTQLKATHDELKLFQSSLPKAIVSELGTNTHVAAVVLSEMGLKRSDIKSLLSGQAARRVERRKRPSSHLLSTKERESLSLVASAPSIFFPEYFELLIPNVDWNSTIAKFQRTGIVKRGRFGFTVSKSVRSKLFETPNDESEYQDKWIDVLKENAEHPDLAFCLSILYTKRGEFEEAIELLSDSAIAMEHNSWNQTFLDTLLTLHTKKLDKIVSVKVRVLHLCAVARCLGRKGCHDEAIRWYKRMQRLSVKHSYKWGVRQSFHATGIELFNLGEYKKAASCFGESIALCKSDKDLFLLGRSLYQSAICCLENGDLDSAEKHLHESEKVKTRCRDQEGELGTLFGFAKLAIAKLELPKAIRDFKKAIQLAKKLQDSRAEALANFNVGMALLDGGDANGSISWLGKAVSISESSDGDEDVLRWALGIRGKAFEAIGEYKKAQTDLKRQYKLEVSAGTGVNAIIALHDIGVTFLRQRKFSAARDKFRESSDLAIQLANDEWIYLSNRGLAATFLEQGNRQAFRDSLIHAVDFLKDKKKYLGALRLLNELLREELAHFNYVELENLTAVCNELTSRISFCDEVFDCLAYRFEMLSKQQLYEEAKKTIELLKNKANKSKDKSMIGRSFFLEGVLNQEQSEIQCAVKCYRKAIDKGKSGQNFKLAVSSLLNLGRLFRELEKFDKAIGSFEEAEKIAQQSGDDELRLLARHNCALCTQLSGDFEAAEKLFREVRDESRKVKDYHEYVSALHGLANLSWHANRPKQALVRYAFARKKALEYRQFEDRVGLAINYSDALVWNKQTEDALAVLKEVEDDAARDPECQRYYISIANLLDDLGRKKGALKYWKLGLETAKKHKDNFHLSMCAGALGGYFLGREDYTQAAGNLELAAQHETDAQLKSNLLVDLLHALLEMGDSKNAQAALNQIQQINPTLDDSKDLVDALMLCADFDWSNKSRKSAGTLVCVAMLHSIEEDFDKYVELCSLWGSWLWKIPNKDRKRTVRRLRGQTKDWMLKQSSEPPDTSNFDFLLWPYEFAVDLIELESSSAEVTEENIADVFEVRFNQVFCN